MRHVGARSQSAPRGEVEAGPDRQLLEAEHVGPIGDGETHHLLEVGAALGRLRVAVKDVPGAYEEGQSAASVGACFGAAASQMSSRGSSISSSARKQI